MRLLYILAICSAVLLLCVFLGKISGRLGVPSLLLFMVLGMCFGSDGFIKIHLTISVWRNPYALPL